MSTERTDRIARLTLPSLARICPSLLNCDFGKLADEIADAVRCGADIVHWDVMDGDFCPNFTYGPPLIQSLRPQSDAIFDAHLMVTEPAKYLDAFLSAGCDIVTFHIEAEADPRPIAERIRRAGAWAGLSLNPKTPLEAVVPFLNEIDLLLVMSVHPGFGGQKFDESVLDKVRDVKKLRPDLVVQIDGGINTETITQAAQAGVDLFVTGSAFYGAKDRQATFRELQRLAKSHS